MINLHQQATIFSQQSTIFNQQSTIMNQQSTIMNQPFYHNELLKLYLNTLQPRPNWPTSKAVHIRPPLLRCVGWMAFMHMKSLLGAGACLVDGVQVPRRQKSFRVKTHLELDVYLEIARDWKGGHHYEWWNTSFFCDKIFGRDGQPCTWILEVLKDGLLMQWVDPSKPCCALSSS